MKYTRFFLLVLLAISACHNPEQQPAINQPVQAGKIVIYQVFTRLFGNTNSTNKAWGTIEENGVGKFRDFTDTALAAIKDLGVTHIWYTGVPHHALVRDYTKYGISNDDPDVVKGRAGSPYAVKDYYNVNPDLAVDPARRLEEFKDLVERTHKHGLKVIIDIVPNHVARHYASLNKPDTVEDFGANDIKSVAYHRDNSFYYIPGKDFEVPASSNGYKPLGGENHPLSDGKFDESPAKWTGNGSRLAQPHADDWYETVKVNYGVRPDGTKDFDSLPPDYRTRPIADHHAFWSGKKVPASWKKFRDIAFFWLNLGVDGFRFDMAEMVPVEFWSYMNAAIKTRNPAATLVAEVYNPTEYRNYIQLGKMDYLYDKVELYDTLKHIIQGHGSTDNLVFIQKGLADIEHHMLHFLENHDEQRIASPGFAGNAEKGKPAMVVSSLISTSPTLIYFGQELGEPGAEDAGFGKPTRTSIFDYVGVPHHQRWMNGGKFDGGQSSPQEKDLRAFYQRLLKFTTSSSAIMGSYSEIHTFNRQNSSGYDERLFSFVRWSDQQKIIVFANFSADKPFEGVLKLPSAMISDWGLKDGTYTIREKLSDNRENKMVIKDGTGTISIKAMPLESQVWSYE